MIILTPPQDYDDSYCISYAKTHEGSMVTNDIYRDAVDKVAPKLRRSTRQWIRAHSISFTFVGDEFLPNPDFRFP